MLPEALDPDTLRTVAIVALIALVAVALLVVRFVQKLLIRIVVLSLLVVVGLAIWVQRDQLASCRTTGTCTFFGQEVQVPDALSSASWGPAATVAPTMASRPGSSGA